MKQDNWHLITSEYPPQIGGVSDYTKLIANGLAAAGDDVHVWCPGGQRSEVRDQRSDIGDQRQEAGERNDKTGKVTVHREFGHFSPADLRRVSRLLDQFPAPRRLLVQWVPHGYGYRSMNLPFCFWLWKRAKLKHDRIEVMVHEPFLAFGEGTRRQDLAAAAHRIMVTILLQSANQIWVSIPDWERQLRPFVLGKRKSFAWLPLPSTIPFVDDPEGVAVVRARYADPDTRLVGHFGAYDRYMTDLMLELLPALLTGQERLAVLLIGKGSTDLRERLVELHPELIHAVHATGKMSASDISRHVSACDLMLQPYQDGVSGRRTSVMTALSHGVPVVTTVGKATESCWQQSRAVQLANVGDQRSIVEAVKILLGEQTARSSMSERGKALYREQFDIHQTVSALRRFAEGERNG